MTEDEWVSLGLLEPPIPPPNQHDSGRNNPEWRCFIKHSDFPAMFSGWSSMKNTRDLHTQHKVFLKRKVGWVQTKTKETQDFWSWHLFFFQKTLRKKITLGSCFGHKRWSFNPTLLCGDNINHDKDPYQTASRIWPICTGWWFQPIWKILVKMGIFPK